MVDVFLAVPELILALAIAALLGPSFTNIIIAITVLGWCRYARIIRRRSSTPGERIRRRRKGYRRLKLRITPRTFCELDELSVVAATLQMGAVVIFAATLSFLGLAEAGLAEWGNLVSQGQSGIISGRWWVATFGGLMVFLWSLGFNLFGDGLRDVLDPRSEGR